MVMFSKKREKRLAMLVSLYILGVYPQSAAYAAVVEDKGDNPSFITGKNHPSLAEPGGFNKANDSSVVLPNEVNAYAQKSSVESYKYFLENYR